MAKFTRGFAGRGRARDPRLPPGQYDTGKTWPVLTAEVTPKPDLASWTFTVEGQVEHPTTWSWDEIHAIMERAVKRGLKRRQAEAIPRLGVDEKAFRKGHKYLTRE